MNSILLTLAGALIGFLVSNYFSKKGSSDLQATESKVIESLEENIRALTTQLSTASKLTQYSFSQLKKSGLEKEAEKLELEAQEEIMASKEILKSIPPKVIEGVDTRIFDNTRPCMKCGKPSFPAGQGSDQGGSLVLYYHCPTHGRFPSNHIDDMVDY